MLNMHTKREKELRVLLDLFMVSDPWPLNDESRNVLESMLNEAAQCIGCDNWIDAYHNYTLRKVEQTDEDSNQSKKK